MSLFRFLLPLIAVAVLSACGGGSEKGGSPSAPNPAPPSTGALKKASIRGPVIEGATVVSIGWDQSGKQFELHRSTTNSKGDFEVAENAKRIEFQVGEIRISSPTLALDTSELWSPARNGILSPYDIVDNRATCCFAKRGTLLPFLSAIDDDADLENGVQVTAAVAAATKGMTINFNRDPANFLTDLANIQKVEALQSATKAGIRGFPTETQALESVQKAWLREFIVGWWWFAFDESYAAAPGLTGFRIYVFEDLLVWVDDAVYCQSRTSWYVDPSYAYTGAVSVYSQWLPAECTKLYVSGGPGGDMPWLSQSQKSQGTLTLINPTSGVRSDARYKSQRVVE